jgi:hypothetical protein
MILVDACSKLFLNSRSKRENMAKSNPHTGSCFDDFLIEEGIYAEVQARALGRALADHVAGTKRHRSFLDEGARADVAMQESGVGYAMPDVHAYVEAKLRGEQVNRPSPVKWRK